MALRLGIEWTILRRGTPNSVSTLEALYAFWISPLAALLALLVSLCSAVALVVLLRARTEERRELRALAGGLFAASLLVISAEPIAEQVRLMRLASITRGLEPDVGEYARLRASGASAMLPRLDVRGCSELTEVAADWPAPSAAGAVQLQAECARGLGDWDQLVRRVGASIPDGPRTSRLGEWVYWWD